MNPLWSRIAWSVTYRSVLLVVFSFAVLHSFIPPFQRGFYCSDESIKKPFRDLFFKTTWLFGTTLFTPLLVVYLIESVWLKSRNVASQVTKFTFSFCVNLFVTELVKRCVGRLRPNTFDFCNLSRYCPGTLVPSSTFS